jgi:hypothetical protein
MNVENADAPTPPVGVIESLSVGFETVAGRLILILLPLIVDMLLWVGPRVSFAPAIDTVIDAYHDQLWEPYIASFNPEMDATWPEFSSEMATVLGDRVTQYFPLVNLPLVGLPVLLAGREAAGLPFGLSPPLWRIASPLGMVGMWLVGLAGSVLLGSLYVALIAQQVGRGGLSLRNLIRRWPANVFWLGLFVVLLPVLIFVLYIPFMALAGGFLMLGGAMAYVGLAIDWGGRLIVLWLMLFLVFTIHGMFMHEKGLFGALWDSVRVVQWNMSATMLLALLFVVLSMAMTYVWNMAPKNSWLAIVGIAGNSFISTGLIAASFVFFKDRYRYWQEVRAELIEELQRRGREQRG